MYRLILLAGVAAAFITYQQVRDRSGGSGSSPYGVDVEQALFGLKELARAVQ